MKIKEQCTSKLRGNYLSLRGTDVREWFDIFSDIASQVPYYLKGIGWVSWGAYLQAKVIYNRHKKELKYLNHIIISGHSLGAGVGLILALLRIQENPNYPCHYSFNLKGSLKVLGTQAREKLNLYVESMDYQVRYRDPVPYLGFWKEPLHLTPRSGDKRSSPLDFDMDAHMKYWDK